MDILNLFGAAKEDYESSPYPSIAQRKLNLNKIKRCLQEKACDITQAIDEGYQGRAKTETALLELFPSIQAIKYARKHLKKWTRTKRRFLGPWLMPAKGLIMPQPKGVVGIVVPWNYPLYLAISPLANALAAGNVVMIKLSEHSERLGTLLQALIKKYEIARVHIILGDVEVAKAFCRLPFNHMLYTGGGEIAKSVMKEASHHLTPITLELGGKSPVIIDKDVSEKLYVRIILGKCLNSGQTCVAPDYIFLPKEKKISFIENAKKIFNRYYPDFKNNLDYSSIISKNHRERLVSLLDDAIEKGAEVYSLGTKHTNEKVIPLTLVFNVTSEMALLKEEIFGPILPVLHYDNLSEVIQHIRGNDKPLAIYYFGSNKQTISRLKKETHSGSLTINETILQVAAENLPFGGVGQSGMGQYHGREGFETFSKMKPIFKQRRYSSFSMLYPPYGKLVNFFLKTVAGIKH
jgi:coniferyl-aldehyde dehydrogenase